MSTRRTGLTEFGEENTPESGRQHSCCCVSVTPGTLKCFPLTHTHTHTHTHTSLFPGQMRIVTWKKVGQVRLVYSSYQHTAGLCLLSRCVSCSGSAWLCISAGWVQWFQGARGGRQAGRWKPCFQIPALPLTRCKILILLTLSFLPCKMG